MNWVERLRQTDLDNWIHFDERELDADGDWGRGYTAIAVADARLSTGAPCPWEWGAGSGISSTADRDLARLMEEIDAIQMEHDPQDFNIRITRRSECKQNQSFDTAKLDAFLDEM